MRRRNYKNSSRFTPISLVIVVVMILGFIVIAPTACTDSKNAVRILEDEGLTAVQITGYKWFACSKEDAYHTGFTATKNGKTVSGVVCAGLFFKGSTVRYF